ncbi:MAG: hypothetical protein IPK63_18910 [Candidatus Competibacteraceae bacterium]|nr:hypothetical protein [Candidatus Competibacteraceae bacterium]
MKWNRDDPTPSDAGWYATLHCWDPSEGFFPGADYWDGETWSDDLPIREWAGPFETEDYADKWAWDNDPDL